MMNERGNGLLLADYRKSVVSTSAPLALAMAFQSANGLVDAAWVSSLDAESSAAVGMTRPLFLIIVALGNGAGVGATALLSRCIGAGDEAGARHIASQACLLSLLISAAVTASMLPLVSPLLAAMGATGYVLAQAEAYGYVTVGLSCVGVVLGMQLSLLRSQGLSRHSMRVNVAVALANMALDPAMIFGLGLGVSGAALATVLSMALGIAVARRMLNGSESIVTARAAGNLDVDAARRMLSIGIPASAGMLAGSLMMMALNSVVVSF